MFQASQPGGCVDERLHQVNAELRAVAGLSIGTPCEGGFAVQTDFAETLMKDLMSKAVLAPLCSPQPISGGANGIKLPAIDESSRVDGSRGGGISMAWTDEGGPITASKPKLRNLELTLHGLKGLVPLTNELLADAAALEAWVRRNYSGEAAFKLDDAILRGTGAGQPLGVLNSPALIQVAKETGQAAATIVAENIMKMWARMDDRGKAVWFINRDIEPQLFSMSLPVGTGGIPVYLPAGGLSQSPYGSLFGRPVIPIEQCSTLGTVGDIVLCNLRRYLLAEKGGVQVAVSQHLYFDSDQTAFRFTLRADGQPETNAPLTPANGSATVSPFVALATRS